MAEMGTEPESDRSLKFKDKPVSES